MQSTYIGKKIWEMGMAMTISMTSMMGRIFRAVLLISLASANSCVMATAVTGEAAGVARAS